MTGGVTINPLPNHEAIIFSKLDILVHASSCPYYLALAQRSLSLDNHTLCSQILRSFLNKFRNHLLAFIMKEWLLFCQEYFEKRSESKYGNHRTSPSLQKPYITAGYELLITDCIWKKKGSVV